MQLHPSAPTINGVPQSSIGTVQGPSPRAAEATKYERASSSCRHSGGVSIAARGLLAEPRALGNEVSWEGVKAEIPGRTLCLCLRAGSGSGGSTDN